MEEELLLRTEFIENDIGRETKERKIRNEEVGVDPFKSKLKEVLSIPMSEEMRQEYTNRGMQSKSGDLLEAISMSMVLQALGGNTTAYTTIRDTMGYKPKENVQNDIKIAIELAPEIKELGE